MATQKKKTKATEAQISPTEARIREWIDNSKRPGAKEEDYPLWALGSTYYTAVQARGLFRLGLITEEQAKAPYRNPEITDLYKVRTYFGKVITESQNAAQAAGLARLLTDTDHVASFSYDLDPVVAQIIAHAELIDLLAFLDYTQKPINPEIAEYRSFLEAITAGSDLESLLAELPAIQDRNRLYKPAKVQQKPIRRAKEAPEYIEAHQVRSRIALCLGLAQAITEVQHKKSAAWNELMRIESERTKHDNKATTDQDTLLWKHKSLELTGSHDKARQIYDRWAEYEMQLIAEQAIADSEVTTQDIARSHHLINDLTRRDMISLQAIHNMQSQIEECDRGKDETMKNKKAIQHRTEDQPEAVQPEAVQPEAVQPEAVQPEADPAALLAEYYASKALKDPAELEASPTIAEISKAQSKGKGKGKAQKPTEAPQKPTEAQSKGKGNSKASKPTEAPQKPTAESIAKAETKAKAKAEADARKAARKTAAEARKTARLHFDRAIYLLRIVDRAGQDLIDKLENRKPSKQIMTNLAKAESLLAELDPVVSKIEMTEAIDQMLGSCDQVIDLASQILSLYIECYKIAKAEAPNYAVQALGIQHKAA